MGAYWGSRYVAVTADIETSRVEQVDLRPIGVSGTSDDLACPLPEHLEGYRSFEYESHAEAVVRRHLWRVTQEKIVELVAAIENTKLTREHIRELEPSDDANQSRIQALTEDMADMTAELKRVRGYRRSRVRVV